MKKVLKAKTIDKWCPHFYELASSLKTKAKAHLDCTDCGLYEGECPYEDDLYEENPDQNLSGW